MALHVLNLRPAYAASQVEPSPSLHPIPSLPPSYITFRHPGYPGPGNILFRLPTFDASEYHGNSTGDANDPDHNARDDTHRDNDDDRVWGVHHGTALQACSIIACNIDGVLSANILQPPPDGVCPLPQPLDWDSLLTAKVYYFYPRSWIASQSAEDLVYPVCPSFQDWQFPHELLPPQWVNVYKYTTPVPRVPKPSQYSAAVMLRDGTCRVTNFDDCTEIAHVIPKRESDWFTRNEMEVYNRNLSLPHNLLTSDMENLICLRCDLHNQFDAANMVFVPKRASSRVHFLNETRQYGPMLHNRETEQFRISSEFLYARFGWAVLPLAQGFAAKVGVKVRVWDAVRKAWMDRVQAPEPDERSRSPRKRMRLQQQGGQAGAVDQGAAADADDMSVEDDPTNEAFHKHPVDIPRVDNLLPTGTPPHLSPTGRDSPPSPPWTPRVGYERRTKIFDGIVSRDPVAAWESLYWHPDAERLEVMKDAYLRAHEPLHEQEIKRQLQILERGCGLYDGEALWEDNSRVDAMLSGDESE